MQGRRMVDLCAQQFGCWGSGKSAIPVAGCVVSFALLRARTAVVKWGQRQLDAGLEQF